MTDYRTEKDALGEIQVPATALWGAATQRAIENFPVSGRRFPHAFIAMLARIKGAAAVVNGELGLLEAGKAQAIAQAAASVVAGEHDDQFPIDIFQTGSGTSTNMNANEVIASLANRELGGTLGTWNPVHPNDDVNLGQSSNDVIPSALHLTAAAEINTNLLPALTELHRALGEKALAFDHIFKTGRTHLMDAMPIRLGQEFGGWARQVERGSERIRRTLPVLFELALGGTAVGTGFGSDAEFAPRVCEILAFETELAFVPSINPFEALQSHSPCVEMSGALTATASSLARIADDVRLLASGPRLGFSELKLPALQPGSSIMPGKVNPVIPEMVVQVATQVMGNDTAVKIGALGGHLELNTQVPVIAANLLDSIHILGNAASLLAERCIADIEADEDRCQESIDMSLALVTALVPQIGYARAAEIAKKAADTEQTIRSAAQGVLPDDELDELLDPANLTSPNGRKTS